MSDNQSAKLIRKLNNKSDETLLYTDTEEKKLQIVEEDESEKNAFSRLNNSSEQTKKKPNMKISGKFALKFRSLIEFECVQFFIQEADFVFYQYIVDFLIPKVCIIFTILLIT